jgi:V/A-type H+-transporting ATPase subunit D
MSDVTPTRSVVVELKDERRAMHEGYVFLDEKCLLLAGEMLVELERFTRMQREFLGAHDAAVAVLRTALARHGLQGLQVYPAASLVAACVRTTRRSLMGVRLQDAELELGDNPAAAAAVNPSPEAQACRGAYASLLRQAAALAAVAGNLERLTQEYRRSVRRARALQDVLLPELDHTVHELETRLEELEQEDAIWMRQGAA